MTIPDKTGYLRLRIALSPAISSLYHWVLSTHNTSKDCIFTEQLHKCSHLALPSIPLLASLLFRNLPRILALYCLSGRRARPALGALCPLVRGSDHELSIHDTPCDFNKVNLMTYQRPELDRHCQMLNFFIPNMIFDIIALCLLLRFSSLFRNSQILSLFPVRAWIVIILGCCEEMSGSGTILGVKSCKDR